MVKVKKYGGMEVNINVSCDDLNDKEKLGEILNIAENIDKKLWEEVVRKKILCDLGKIKEEEK